MMKLLTALLVAPAAAQLLLDFQGHDTASPINHGNNLAKRKTVEQDLLQKFSYYETTVSLGSPGQEIKLLLDTGSSDLWVLGPQVDCGGGGLFSNGVDCSVSGVFDTSKSSTYVKNSSIPFNILYNDGSKSSGYYGTDNLGLGGVKVSDFTFAVADVASDGQAVLGVGPLENEQSLYNPDPYAYPNLPLKLMMEGITKSSAFSLWLNDKDALKGSILFGGYDRAKIDGDLFTVPIVNTNAAWKGRSQEYTVQLDGVKVGGQTVGSSTPALLDSGTTLCYLPQSMVNAILGQFSGVSYSARAGYYTKCSNKPQGSVEFIFSGNKLVVQLEDLMKPLENPDGSKITTDGEQACGILVTPNDGANTITQSVILGASFLRSAYVVYDSSAQQISMGQAKYGVSESDIVELTEGGEAISSKQDEKGTTSKPSPTATQSSPTTQSAPASQTSTKATPTLSTIAVVVRPSDTSLSAYITNIVVTPTPSPTLSTVSVVVRPSDTRLSAFVTEIVVTPSKATETITITSCSDGSCSHRTSTLYKYVDATLTQTIWSCSESGSVPKLQTSLNTPAYQAPSAPPVFLPAWGTQSNGETVTQTHTSFFNPDTYTRGAGGGASNNQASTNTPNSVNPPPDSSSGPHQASSGTSVSPIAGLLVLVLSSLIL